MKKLNKKFYRSLGATPLRGGSMYSLSPNVVRFQGQKHSGSNEGIDFNNQVKVEDNETMGPVTLRKKGGPGLHPYVFSEYIKMDGKKNYNKGGAPSVADAHANLVSQNAPQWQIDALAKFQEQKAGRSGDKIAMAKHGGPIKYQEKGSFTAQDTLDVRDYRNIRDELIDRDLIPDPYWKWKSIHNRGLIEGFYKDFDYFERLEKLRKSKELEFQMGDIDLKKSEHWRIKDPSTDEWIQNPSTELKKGGPIKYQEEGELRVKQGTTKEGDPIMFGSDLYEKHPELLSPHPPNKFVMFNGQLVRGREANAAIRKAYLEGAEYIDKHGYTWEDPEGYSVQIQSPLVEAGHIMTNKERRIAEKNIRKRKRAAGEYSGASEWGHGILDVFGMVPGFGEIFDGINSLWYSAQGRPGMAATSTAAMLPFLGWGATGGKWGYKGTKYIDEALNVSKHVTKNAKNQAKNTKKIDALTKKIDAGKNVTKNKVKKETLEAANKTLINEQKILNDAVNAGQTTIKKSTLKNFDPNVAATYTGAPTVPHPGYSFFGKHIPGSKEFNRLINPFGGRRINVPYSPSTSLSKYSSQYPLGPYTGNLPSLRFPDTRTLSQKMATSMKGHLSRNKWKYGIGTTVGGVTLGHNIFEGPEIDLDAVDYNNDGNRTMDEWNRYMKENPDFYSPGWDYNITGEDVLVNPPDPTKPGSTIENYPDTIIENVSPSNIPYIDQNNDGIIEKWEQDKYDEERGPKILSDDATEQEEEKERKQFADTSVGEFLTNLFKKKNRPYKSERKTRKYTEQVPILQQGGTIDESNYSEEELRAIYKAQEESYWEHLRSIPQTELTDKQYEMLYGTTPQSILTKSRGVGHPSDIQRMASESELKTGGVPRMYQSSGPVYNPRYGSKYQDFQSVMDELGYSFYDPANDPGEAGYASQQKDLPSGYYGENYWETDAGKEAWYNANKDIMEEMNINSWQEFDASQHTGSFQDTYNAKLHKMWDDNKAAFEAKGLTLNDLKEFGFHGSAGTAEARDDKFGGRVGGTHGWYLNEEDDDTPTTTTTTTTTDTENTNVEYDLDYSKPKRGWEYALPLISGLTQLWPPLEAKKLQPHMIQAGVTPNVKLARQDFNKDRSSLEKDFRSVNRFIETSASGPSAITNKLAALSNKANEMMKISGEESKKNIDISAVEAGINKDINIDNMKNALLATSANQTALKEMDELKLKAKDVAASRISGILGDTLKFIADERRTSAIEGQTGIMDRESFRRANEHRGWSDDEFYAAYNQYVQDEQARRAAFMGWRNDTTTASSTPSSTSTSETL